jgi:hypothetical protein
LQAFRRWHAFEPAERNGIARFGFGELGLRFALEREDAADARVAAVALRCSTAPSFSAPARTRARLSLPPCEE